MELLSLFVGLLLATVLFALKAGAGLHFALRQRETRGAQLAFLSCFCLLYAAPFWVSLIALRGIDVVHHLEVLQGVLRLGTVHFLFALGLLGWAALLLRMPADSGSPTRRRLFLAVPGPVCVAVIFLATALTVTFTVSYFPDAGAAVCVAPYTSFLATSLVSCLLFQVWHRRADPRPEVFLGAGMFVLAVYFLLAAMPLPELSEIISVYRLSGYEGKQVTSGQTGIAILTAAGIVLFAVGFIHGRRKIRRPANCR